MKQIHYNLFLLILFFYSKSFSQDTILKPENEMESFLKINVQIGAVINNLYCNKPKIDNPNIGHGSSESYSGFKKNNFTGSVNIGLNALFGRNPHIKYCFGVNYLRSKGEFNYSYGQGGYTSYSENFHFNSKIDFINLVTGPRFSFGKKFHIEPLIAVKLIAHADVRFTGTSTTQSISGGPTPTVYSIETTVYENQKETKNIKTESTVSFNPEISYDLKIKEFDLGLFISYNMAIRYKLPWWVFGVNYYPFKK